MMNTINEVIITEFETYADIKMMIRIGSFAIDIQNIANGGPNAMKAQPKNSITVILLSLIS